MKKSTLVYVLIALVVVLGGISLYVYLQKNWNTFGDDGDNNVNIPGNDVDGGAPDDGRDYSTYKSITEGDFVLQYKYVGESTWDYRITGTLPNPCYEVKVDSLVRESYPEQVVFNLDVIEPEKDVMCAQVIKDYSYSGVFNASEKATVELNVTK